MTNLAENELIQILEHCQKEGYEVEGASILQSQIVMEERVKMNCFYCGNYNKSWKCPPKIPAIDVEKMIREFDYAALISMKKPITEQTFQQARNDSSVELHKALLVAEKWLWDNNNVTALSFIGGSCKLCKNGCTPDNCANPYQARSPVEALGINVVASAKKVGIDIVFPPKDYIVRMGLLLW